MKTLGILSLWTLSIFSSISVVCGDELDDLLKSEKKVDAPPVPVEESEAFKESYGAFVKKLEQKDYAGAGDILAELQNEKGYISPRRREFLSLASRVVRYAETLEADKNAFRAEYQKVSDSITEAERGIRGVQLEAEATMKRHGGQLPAIFKEGLDKRYLELQTAKAANRKKLDEMKAVADSFEANRANVLEKEVSTWIQGAGNEEDIVAALALTETYQNRVSQSDKIRLLREGMAGKRAELETAEKIAGDVPQIVKTGWRLEW